VRRDARRTAALAIVVVGLLPVILLSRAIARARQSASAPNAGPETAGLGQRVGA
jgi:hypothetical protein